MPQHSASILKQHLYCTSYQTSGCFTTVLLPALLLAGIDVNVKFHNAHAFEPTPEVAVFDLLGIPLVHGWLVDPQDKQAAAVFGTR
jgi:hypothetical protein